ncbi:MAG TPA: MarR family transcriptional regulator [Bryobacteraceae bacterium]|nr:MarR family transcriptional regulator [Bryobacteraceae bacterium]
MPIIESITESDYAALAEFRYQIRRFLHFSEQAARAAGIEPQQHQLLLAIKGTVDSQEEPTIGILAERLQLQHHSTGELVDRLAERGLVSRSRAPADRRQVLIHLTARGEAELEKLTACHLAELRTNGPALVSALEAAIRRNDGTY